jgi:tetratricopeptide (TPR) repeat protein/O-antigen ligase
MERLCQRVLEGILISIIIFTPFPFGSVQPWAIAVIEVAALVLGLLWFFKFLAQGKIEFVKTPLNLLIIFWLGFILFQLSTTTSYFQATKTEFLKSFFYCMILLVFINNIQRKFQIQKIITTLIVIGFIISFFGIIQDLTWNGKMFWLFPLTHRGRPFGPYVNVNHFAGYISMLIPLSIGYLFSLKGKYGLSFKPFLILAILVMFAALFSSVCRAGIVSLLLSLVFMGFLLVRLKSAKIEKQLPFVFVILMLIGLAWFGSGRIVEKFSHLNDPSWQARLWVWRGTIEIIKDFPLLGTGLGTFVHIFPKYRLPQTKLFFSYAHNDFLELLSEGGVLGFAFISILFFFFLRKTVRLLFSRRDTWAINLTVGGLSSFLAISIFSFSDFNLHIPANTVLLCVIIGLITTVVNLRPKLGEGATLFHKRILYLNPKMRIVLYPLGIVIFATLFIFITKPYLAERNFELSLKVESSKEKIEYLKRSIWIQPHDARYHYSLAQVYGEKEGEWTLALNHFRQAVSLNPNSAQYYEGLAWAYANLDREEETIKYLRKAIDLEPNNPYRHRNLALFYLYYQAKKGPPDRYFQDAIFEYKKAILLEPSLSQEALGKFSELVKDYRQLKTIIPDTPQAHLELSKYLRTKDREEESKQEFQKAIEGWQSRLLTASDSQRVGIHRNLASVYMHSKQYSLALSQYQKALKIAPRDAWTYYRIGTLYEKMGDEDKAVDSFKQAIYFDSGHSWAYYKLAKIYESQDDSISSISMWNAILKIRNGDQDAKRIAKRELKEYEKRYDNQ